MTNYTDNQLIEMIRLSSKGRDVALKYIFTQWRVSAQSIMVANGASHVDAEEAVQEAMITLDRNLRSGKYEALSSLKSYFIGICKGRIYSNRRSTQRIVWTDDNLKMDGVEIQEPEGLMLEGERKKVLMDMINMLDAKCQEVLKFYKLSYNMTEIADEANLGNSNNARQWVYKCKNRLKKLVSKNALFVNYFSNVE